MASIRETSPGRWFRRVMWIGIIANLALAIPTMLFPAMMLARNNLPPADPLLWPQFAALLLILLSVFYMPAGIDPIAIARTPGSRLRRGWSASCSSSSSSRLSIDCSARSISSSSFPK